MLQAVIFDHDGTMAPTMERQHKWFEYWWNHSINKKRVKGKKFPYKNFKVFMEMYNDQIAYHKEVQNVYDFLNLDCDMNDFDHPVWPAYKNYVTEHPSTLYPGMKEAIEEIWKLGQLKRNGNNNRRLRLGVNTSNSWRIVGGDLEKNDVLKYFDSYISNEILLQYQGAGDADGLKKPSKISLALAMGLLDSEGKFTVHLGDTLNDLVASKKIMRLNPNRPENLIAVANTWGYATAGEGKEKARSVLEKGIEIPNQGRVYFNHIIDTPQEFVNIVRSYWKE